MHLGSLRSLPVILRVSLQSLALLLLIASTGLFLFSFLDIPKVVGWLPGLCFYLALILFFIYFFSNVYVEHGIVDVGGGVVTHDIKDAIYFSIVTWTTLGYGDFQPTQDARIWASIEALLGYVYLGILVGLIITSLTPEKSQFAGKKPAKKYNEW